MGKREKYVFLFLVVVAFVSFGYSSAKLVQQYTAVIPAQSGMYIEGVLGQPRFLNPLYATTNTDKALVDLIYSGLYRFDEDGNVVADLAAGFPEVTDDGKTYTVKLRDAQWHNGLPVTSADVAFTIRTLQNAEFNSPRRSEWLSTTVETPDEKTVVFKLKSASGPFLNNLTLPLISEVVRGKETPEVFLNSIANIEAIGSGPYRVKEVKKTNEGKIQTLTLESFQNFTPQPAYISIVKLNFYETSDDLLKAMLGNQIDGFGFSQFEQRISIKQSAKNLEIHQIPMPQYQAVFINTAQKSLGDNRVRQALNMTADKTRVLNEVFEGQGLLIDSPILTQHVSNLPELNLNTDLAAANSLLDQAGWTLDPMTNIRKKGANELKFTMATNDSGINVRSAEILIEAWKAIGVNVTLNTLPTRELNESVIKPRNYDMLLFAQKLGADPDPFVFWHSSQTKSPGLNLSNYSNTKVDGLMSEARASTNKTERDALYLQIHDIIKQDLPAIFLVQSVYTYAISDEIKGFNIHSLPDETARFYNLRYWYLDTKRVFQKN
ncbi:peptide ABC transporter substrate-binding protein [bacterium]|nr:MAG: peptide ABC transporter substrate-binding protein [bacterium]